MQTLATLQRRRYPEREAEKQLAKALRGRGGAITIADAAALTGLSVDQSEAALKALAGNYKSHLAVTEDGDLLYSFDPAMVRRDRVTLRDRLDAVGAVLWRGFKLAFKIAIAVVLVAYFVAFVAMLIALVFARSSSDRDDRRRDDGGGFGFPWILWWMMPDWAPPEVQRRQLQRRQQGPQKRFYQKVFDFVFGPNPGPQDPLGAEKELVAFIRARDGRITATDLVALGGWSYARAEEEATRLLVDYDGEPEVDESGTIVYVFPSLRRTAGGAVDASWRYAWQERYALAPLTGNTSAANVAIGGLNGFNLLAGFTIAPAFLQRFGLTGEPTLEALTTWVPLAFSSVFFAVPAMRALVRRPKARRMARMAVRAQLVRELVARRGGPVEPEAIGKAVEERLGIAAGPGEGIARRELERLLKELDGDVTTDDAGVVRYVFPRIAEDIDAAERARARASDRERTAGAVVFSSEDELPLAPPGPEPLEEAARAPGAGKASVSPVSPISGGRALPPRRTSGLEGLDDLAGRSRIPVEETRRGRAEDGKERSAKERGES